MNIKINTAVRNANTLLNLVLVQQKLDTDAALSKRLAVAPSVISKIRHGHTSVTDALLIIMHETTGMSIKQLKDILQYGAPAPPSLPARLPTDPPAQP